VCAVRPGQLPNYLFRLKHNGPAERHGNERQAFTPLTHPAMSAAPDIQFYL